VPKLVLQGTADEVCKPANLELSYPTWAPPKRLEWVEGAGHFFDRRLVELGAAIERGLA
jgi:alpha/beta superfamily hydrolase